MKTFKVLTALAVVASLAVSCNNDDNGTEPTPNGSVNFKIDLVHNGQDVELFDTIALSANTDFYMSLFRMYLSRIKATDEAGNTVEISPVEIFSPGTDSASVFTAEIPADNYQSVSIGFGLDDVLNNSDPGSFAASHPLSFEETMYWPMLKYRFIKYEGTIFEGGMSVPVAYHTGYDIMYYTETYSEDFSVAEGEEVEMILTLHMDQFFDGPAGMVDYMAQPTWHGDSTTTLVPQTFSANLAQSATLEIR